MKHTILLAIALLLLPGSNAYGQISTEEIAKESEAAAQATASEVATPEQIMEKVNKACDILKTEGEAGYKKLQGKGSEFIYAGTYIWSHDENGVMLFHPIKPSMVGRPLIGLKDVNGKRFFVEMNDVVKTKGKGWVQYMWPKPGEVPPSRKVSYVEGCLVDGKNVIVGSGVYDMDDATVKKLTGE